MTVKLFASLRNGRFAETQWGYVPGITVSRILEELHIDRRDVGILLVNFCHVQPDFQLQEGDTISIFPIIGGG